MSCLAVIPARGGSKRIPRKNVKDFNGKPVIENPIRLALNSGIFTNVVVSTDDKEIGAIARKCGANVPFDRGPSLSDDFSTTVEVISDTIQFELNNGRAYDFVCCLYPVTPLLRVSRISEGLSRLKETKASYVFPAIEFDTPIQRAFKEGEKGFIELLNQDFANTRTQDISPYFHDAGQFYWARSETWLKKETIIGSNSQIIKLDKYEVIDIDNSHDWKFAEEISEIRSRAH